MTAATEGDASLAATFNGARRIEIHHLTWQGIEIEIKWEPQFIGQTGCLHIRSLTRARLPISKGSRNLEFPKPETVAAASGPVAFVQALLDAAARKRSWRKYVAAQMQPSLF